MTEEQPEHASHVEHKVSQDTQPHAQTHVIKKPSKWKRVRKRIWAVIERLALKLLSKLLNISPPPSPTSETRHVNN